MVYFMHTVEDKLTETTQLLQSQEDKANNLARLKTKLEAQLADTEGALDTQRKETAELDKVLGLLTSTLESL